MESLVEFVKVLAWPLTILILVLTFFSRFKIAFDYFLRNIRSLSFPGGSLETQNSPSEPASDGSITLTKNQSEELALYIKNLQNEHNIASQTNEDLIKLLDKSNKEEVIWKFVYLNLFFVERTKLVLQWFAENPQQTRAKYHQIWSSIIPTESERNIIIEGSYSIWND